MGQFDRQVATAKRLIAQYGVAMLWCRQGVIIPDADKPWLETGGAVSRVATTLCFIPEKEYRYMLGTGLERSEVPTGDLFALMGETTFTPALNDWIAFPATPTILYATVKEPIINLSPNLSQNILWTLRLAQ